MPSLIKIVEELRAADKKKPRRLTHRFDNSRNLSEATKMITERLERLAQKSQKGAYLTILEEQEI
jgi:phosphopantothenate synthetase